MVGQNVYTDPQIKFVLDRCLEGIPGEEISRQYDLKFKPKEGGKLTANRLRYVKNKYGKDPKFDTCMINKGMGRKRKRASTNVSGNPKSSYQDWKNDGLNTELSAPPAKRPALASKAPALATVPSNGKLLSEAAATPRMITLQTPNASQGFTFTPQGYPQYPRPENSAMAVNSYQSQMNRQFSPIQSANNGASYQSNNLQGNSYPYGQANLDAWSPPQLPPIRVPPGTEAVASAMYSSVDGIEMYNSHSNNFSLVSPYDPSSSGQYFQSSSQYAQNPQTPRMRRPSYGNYQYQNQLQPYNERNTLPPLAGILAPMSNQTLSSPVSYEGIDPFLSDASGEGTAAASSSLGYGYSFSTALDSQYHGDSYQFCDQTASIDSVIHSNSAPLTSRPPLTAQPSRAGAPSALNGQSLLNEQLSPNEPSSSLNEQYSPTGPLSSMRSFPENERSYAGGPPPSNVDKTPNTGGELPTSGGEPACSGEHIFAGEHTYSAEPSSETTLSGPRADPNSVSSTAWNEPTTVPQARELIGPSFRSPQSQNSSPIPMPHLPPKTVDPRILDSIPMLDRGDGFSLHKALAPLDRDQLSSDMPMPAENAESERSWALGG
ncbi:Fc.00g018820.m01.CDS01 [Cosmosporella sp. VM-42]